MFIGFPRLHIRLLGQSTKLINLFYLIDCIPILFTAISARMIDRIFSGAVTRGAAQQEGKMSYTEFVWFLLAEEDKRAATSIEYW